MSRRYGHLMMVGFLTLTASAGPGFAHDLKVLHTVLPDHKIQVYCWYNGLPRPTDAKGADVEVMRPGREPIKGLTDEQGVFTFGYDRAEELTIVVRQGTHVSQPADVVHVDELEGAEKASDGSATSSGTSSGDGLSSGSGGARDAHDAAAGMRKAAEQSVVQLLKDLLLGVAVILSVAAFVLSVRNARRLRHK
jgi:hypothetical protein